MTNIKVYNQSGQEVGEMELPKVFDLPWNADLVHQTVVAEMSNRRAPIAHVKDRSKVSGGGRKPWRQKGTGRARHGSIRSPLWKGGGVTHGPTKERNFKKGINKKAAAKALATVIAAKVRDGEFLVLDDLSLTAPKTKEAATIFQNLAKIKSFADITAKANRVLLVLPEKSESIKRAARNLPFLNINEARNITAAEAINRKYLVLPKVAVAVLEKRLAQK